MHALCVHLGLSFKWPCLKIQRKNKQTVPSSKERLRNLSMPMWGQVLNYKPLQPCTPACKMDAYRKGAASLFIYYRPTASVSLSRHNSMCWYLLNPSTYCSTVQRPKRGPLRLGIVLLMLVCMLLQFANQLHKGPARLNVQSLDLLRKEPALQKQA